MKIEKNNNFDLTTYFWSFWKKYFITANVILKIFLNANSKSKNIQNLLITLREMKSITK